MRVKIYEFFSEVSANCDNQINPDIHNGAVAAYTELHNNGLVQNTFDGLTCQPYYANGELEQSTGVGVGDVLFVDTGNSIGPVALFRLSRGSVSKSAVKDIVLRMHELSEVPGQSGYYSDSSGDTLNSNESVKSGACPSWIPRPLRSVLCNQYGCPSWMPKLICNNESKAIKWVLILLFVVLIVTILNRK